MDEILEALKAKYEGVSETILKVTANSMRKKGLSSSAVEETNLEQVIKAYGDDRATQAAKTALKDIKPANEGGEQGKGGEPENKTAPETDVPAWAKAIIDQNKALADKLAKLEGEKITGTRRSQIEALANQLPEKLRSPYKRISVEGLTDEEFTALHGELKTEIEGIAATANAAGVSFAAPPAAAGGTPTTEATAAEAAELLKSM